MGMNILFTAWKGYQLGSIIYIDRPVSACPPKVSTTHVYKAIPEIKGKKSN